MSALPASPVEIDAGPAPRSAVDAPDRLVRLRRRYHFHLPGLVYAITTVFLAIGAINSQNNLLFWTFGLAVAGMLVSGFVSGATLMGLEIAREVIAPAEVGGVMTIRYRVSNTNRFMPALAVNLTELPGRGGGSDAVNWPAHVPEPFAFVPAVRAGRTEVAEAPVRPVARGEVRFQALSAWTVFPFGLIRKSVTFTGDRTAIVRPRAIEAPPPPAHPDASPSPNTGLARSRVGLEFFALREYQPDDSPRAIAWRRSARTGETVVRQYAADAESRVWIVLELDREDRDAGEHAISLAAGHVRRALQQSNAVGLIVTGQGIHVTPRAGRGHAEALFDTLAVIPAVTPGAGEPVSLPAGRDRVIRVRAERAPP